jgi:hypothetical protein
VLCCVPLTKENLQEPQQHLISSSSHRKISPSNYLHNQEARVAKRKNSPKKNVLGKPALLLVVSYNLLREKQILAKQSDTRNRVSKNLWANKIK